MKYFLLSTYLLAALLLCPSLVWAQAEAVAPGGTPRPDRHQPTAPQKGNDWLDPLTDMEFVWLEWDCFMMGSQPTDKEKGPDEVPPHNVCIDPFWMARYEVTISQFRYFVEETGYRTDAERGHGCYVWNGRKWIKKPGANWKKPGPPQGENHPVLCVSWNDAARYAEWLNGHYQNVQIRLPTEAEWEFAARGGTWQVRPWGKNPNEACEYGNVADRTAKKRWPAWPTHDCDDGFAGPAPVGSFMPNNYGLYDMIGNTWEWVRDWYSYSSYYNKSPNRNPKGPGDGINKVFRGGAWSHGPSNVRSAARARISPQSATDFIGFRLAIEPPHRSLVAPKSPAFRGQ